MKSLRSILNIEFLVKEDALKNWRMMVFLSVLAVIMISSGHSADKKISKIASLNTFSLLGSLCISESFDIL